MGRPPNQHRAPTRPEWSVASDAEGGSGERGGP